MKQKKQQAPIVCRRFPFTPGKRPGPGNLTAAQDALSVFDVLHEACSAGRVSVKQLHHLFFRSTSDLISYREGWKAGKFWSVEAWRKAVEQRNTNGLISEHVLPRSVVLETAVEMPLEQARKYIWDMSFECVVTRPENKKLPRKKGYPDDPWRRYAEAGIRVLDVTYEGVPLLTDDDREVLMRHGILAPWSESEADAIRR